MLCNTCPSDYSKTTTEQSSDRKLNKISSAQPAIQTDNNCWPATTTMSSSRNDMANSNYYWFVVYLRCHSRVSANVCCNLLERSHSVYEMNCTDRRQTLQCTHELQDFFFPLDDHRLHRLDKLFRSEGREMEIPEDIRQSKAFSIGQQSTDLGVAKALTRATRRAVGFVVFHFFGSKLIFS